MNGPPPSMSSALAEVARQFGGARLAAELFDEDWNLVWVSDELKTLLGERDEAELGIDLDRITYTTVGELSGADAKAVRDAGGIAVAELPKDEDRRT